MMAAGGGAAPSPPPRTPARPPRPPTGGGGYPAGLGMSRSSGGYPDGAGSTVVDKSPRHKAASPSGHRRHRSSSNSKGLSSSTPALTDSSPRRRKASASPAPAFCESSFAPEGTWEEVAEAVLARLQELASNKEQRRDNPDLMAEMCGRIWDLAADIQVSQSSRSSHFAGKLLKEVMGFMDLKDMKDPRFLFTLSRSALALLRTEGSTAGFQTSGVQQAYLNISQGLFKYSQKDEHDADFLGEHLIEPLLEVLDSDAPECASNDLRVYVAGILKNISHNEENQRVLAERGAVTTLFKLLRGEQLSGNSKEAQLLIQATAALRNFAGKRPEDFLREDRLDTVTRVMALFPSNVELLTNVSRIFAKLTLNGPACEAFARNGTHLRQIAKTLSANSDSTPLTLRLAFVLGNLTEFSDRLRVIFAFDCEGTALAPQLLGKYWQKERQLARIERDQAAQGIKEIDEVLVKLVRLIANIAISATAGSTLASSSAVVDPLLDMLGAKKIMESEELVLNVVSAVTNLLFYDEPSNLLFQEDNKQLLCRLFRPLLQESLNVEALVETARALGNLSRHSDARKCMSGLRIDERLVILLDHEDRDLVFPVCGALVNLAADPECTGRLMTATPIVRKLAELLNDAPPDDPGLRLVSVKVLTNLSLDTSVRWSAVDVQAVRTVLLRIPSDCEEVAAELEEDEQATAEMQQLLELARRLLQRLPVVEPGEGEGSGEAEVKLLSRSAAVSSGVGPAAGAASAATAAGGVGGEACARPPTSSPVRPPTAKELAPKDMPKVKDKSSSKGLDGAEVACKSEGCSRRFASEAKMLAHFERRHDQS